MLAEYLWLDPLRLGGFHDGQQWWRLIYGQGRSPLGVENGRERYLILTDQVGTALALATTDGRIVQAMRYDCFGNLLEVRGNAVRLPLGFAGGLYDPDTGLTRFVWRDYDADTGRFTALDPLRDKGGNRDWYGYCVDDPVNRVDVLGLFSLFGFDFGGDSSDRPATGTGDDNGTMRGDYMPIEIGKGKLPFMLDPSVTLPVPEIVRGLFGGDKENAPKEIRIPVLPPDIIVDPFFDYYKRQQEKQK